MRGFVVSPQYSEKASLFDLGSVGVLAIENVLNADTPSLSRIVMSALSEALMYLGSRQDVRGSAEVLRSVYRQNAASMYRELWTLATDYRKSLAAKDVREIQEGIDAFFRQPEGDAIPIEARIAILRQFLRPSPDAPRVGTPRGDRRLIAPSGNLCAKPRELFPEAESATARRP